MKLSKANKELIQEIKNRGEVPRHIAIIMDGNGRWARKRGLPRVAGHRRGVEVVREVVESCVLLGVEYLTLYTFSTENWKRPKDEVSTLMRLVVKSLQNETNELHANEIKITTIGNIDQLPVVVQSELNQATEKTKNNTKMILNLALSYSGRWEITEAIRKISELSRTGELKSEDIDEQLVSRFLSTKDMPDPDLLIRSGGEMRISNFLIWQVAYSEMYVTKILWPEFKLKQLLNAISDYQSRERRFGLISEQVSKNRKRIEDVEKLSRHTAEI